MDLDFVDCVSNFFGEGGIWGSGFCGLILHRHCSFRVLDFGYKKSTAVRRLKFDYEICICGGIEMSNKSCLKKTMKEIFLTDWAFAIYAVLFSWFSGIGSLAAQVWRFGGFSFALSTLDVARLAIGLVGFSVCIFICFKMGRNKLCKEC